MRKVKLTEGLSLSAVVQGFWRLDNWNMTPEELVTFMHGCIERGVTTFDTAEIYGGAEEKMGEAFKLEPSLLKKIELVSKTGIYQTEVDGETFGYYNTKKERVIQSCKESLKKLNADHLDLYLIHREDPLLNPWDTAEALLQLKKEGLVREIGVSNMDPYKFEAINGATGGQIVTNQIEWNPLCFEHFKSGMIDYLTYHKIHPMIWSPLAGGNIFNCNDENTVNIRKVIGKFADKYGVEPATIIYAWIMYHPVGAMPLVGSQKLERLDLAIKALDVKLEQSEWFEIWKACGQQIR